MKDSIRDHLPTTCHSVFFARIIYHNTVIENLESVLVYQEQVAQHEEYTYCTSAKRSH